jgi:hypothetical protein
MRHQLEQQHHRQHAAHAKGPGQCAAAPAKRQQRQQHSRRQRKGDGLVGKVGQEFHRRNVSWQRRGRMFFSEEKNQKTFISGGLPALRHSRDVAVSAGIKVFCFYSAAGPAPQHAAGVGSFKSI